jgi:hypothetical protein
LLFFNLKGDNIKKIKKILLSLPLIARKSNNYRYCDSWESNRENPKNAIALLKK